MLSPLGSELLVTRKGGFIGVSPLVGSITAQFDITFAWSCCGSLCLQSMTGTCRANAQGLLNYWVLGNSRTVFIDIATVNESVCLSIGRGRKRYPGGFPGYPNSGKALGVRIPYQAARGAGC